MTRFQANFVKRLVINCYTYRAIAREYYDRYAIGVRSNQIVGMDLVEDSEKILGLYYDEFWDSDNPERDENIKKQADRMRLLFDAIDKEMA